MTRSHRSALCFALSLAVACSAHPTSSTLRQLRTRNLVDSINTAYDFVIVGGGQAGLVLGARLSEDAGHSVLVLEAGSDGADVQTRINTPGDAYYASLWPTAYNWNFNTAPQTSSGGKVVAWPRGRGLGGSAAMNGLYMTRPGELEVNAWHDRLQGMDGADNWSWGSFFAAMKKSETFAPPSNDIAQQAGISWDASTHGTTGPIYHSYPGYTFPQVGGWKTALSNVGVAASDATYGGQNWGAYIANSCINPTNWTRSYSRSGYLDPLPPRANYHVLVNAHVSRLIFNPSSPSGNLAATGVEFSKDGGVTRTTVTVNKEVILAGGSVGSPHVLLNSGVGPRDILSAAGVAVVHELPGVGQHLQDHVAVAVQFSTDQPNMGSVFAAGGPEATDPVYLSFINSAVAHVNLTAMLGPDAVSPFQGTAGGAYQAAIGAVPSTDSNVLAGFKANYDSKVAGLATPSPQVEVLLALNTAGAVRVTAAIQHPFSQGYLYINSSNPFDPPVIDPRYLSNPTDVTLLREGLKLARKVGQAAPYNSFTGEAAPGTDVQTDEQWDAWLPGQISTEFHPSSTCSMLPLNQGGVVDANLRVYGLANVRVADASVPPVTFGAHLMTTTYAVAEQASTIIRASYTGQGGTTTGSPSPTHSAGHDGSAHVAPTWTMSVALAAVVLISFSL